MSTFSPAIHVHPAVAGGWLVRTTGRVKGSNFKEFNDAFAAGVQRAKKRHIRLCVHRVDGTVSVSMKP